jgi:hypothetical protein
VFLAVMPSTRSRPPGQALLRSSGLLTALTR